jgi:hypothetical protein
MNIHDVSTKYKVSITALRKLERGGLLQFDPTPSDEHEDAPQMRFYLARNQQLPIKLLLSLLDDSTAFFDLRKYEARARGQIAELGDVQASVAPLNVLAAISDAAGGDAGACGILADWLRSILPAEPVSHYWVAARLLFPLTEFQRDSATKAISFALMHMRRLESFAGYWASVPNGKKKPTIKYFQKKLDALDL